MFMFPKRARGLFIASSENKAQVSFCKQNSDSSSAVFSIPTYIWYSERKQKIRKKQKKSEICQLTDLQFSDGL